MVVPPPPPVFGDNTSQGTSYGYTQEQTPPEYIPQPIPPVYTPTPQPVPSDYSQQYASNNGPKPKKPDNHLLKAVISTILCVPILGVVAIVYAAQVDSNYNSGFYEDAEDKSRKANGWANAAMVVGLILWLIIAISYIVFMNETSY